MMAKTQGCVCVVDFHFNSATEAGAKGAEVIYQDDIPASKEFAQAIWAEIRATGLPAHGKEPVKSTKEAPRGAYINHFEMPTVLIEPLFISNDDQAHWLHDFKGENIKKLASVITLAIKGQFLGGGTIGLSPGHAYKTSSPKDKGSTCKLKDYEVDHVLKLVELVEEGLKR